jgi:hypothetical protein
MKPAERWRGLAATASAKRGRQGQRRERRAEVGAVEVGAGEARLGGDDPVGAGDEVVAGHRLQHLADVDDDGARRRVDVEPLAVGGQGLQAADAVLQQQREEAGVVVGVDALPRRAVCAGS